MTTESSSRALTVCKGLTDEAVLYRLKALVACEKRAVAFILSLIAEVDERRLHEKEGYQSLFWYCVRELGYSEDAAAKRIHVARVARTYPAVFSLLADGGLTLATASILAAHLTRENHAFLLGRAQGMSRRETEKIIAGLVPKPDAADAIRRVSTRHEATRPADALTLASVPSVAVETSAAIPEVIGNPQSADSPPTQSTGPPSSPTLSTTSPGIRVPVYGSGDQKIAPLSPGRFKISFTASEELLNEIERIRGLIRHQHPRARLEDVFGVMADFFLERRDPDRRIQRKLARKAAAAPGVLQSAGRDAARGEVPGKARERRIPQEVKDVVWVRDGGRCAFVSTGGKRCEAKEWLEYDHIRPWALGGASDREDNVRLLCRTHNQMEARRCFPDYSGR